jgi:uncharacterized protein YecE (DUF72 family)
VSSEVAALSRLFDLIEITSSYYHPLNAKTAQLWLIQAQDNARLRFIVRVWQKLVHEKSSSWQTDVETVKRGLLPLQKSRRLGALVLPFPLSFRFTHNNEEWLWRLLDAFTGFPLVVEAPHASWQHSALLPRLPALGVAVAAADQLHDGDKSPPATSESMHRIYLRLNGRQSKSLEPTATRDERFDYFYHAEEISSLAAAVRQASHLAESCYVTFHNYPKGQAFANALQLQFALTAKRIRMPENLRRRFPALEAIAAGAHPDQLEMF